MTATLSAVASKFSYIAHILHPQRLTEHADIFATEQPSGRSVQQQGKRIGSFSVAGPPQYLIFGHSLNARFGSLARPQKIRTGDLWRLEQRRGPPTLKAGTKVEAFNFQVTISKAFFGDRELVNGISSSLGSEE